MKRLNEQSAAPITTWLIRLSCGLLLSEIPIQRHQRSYNKSRNRRQHDPDEEMLIPDAFLQPRGQDGAADAGFVDCQRRVAAVDFDAIDEAMAAALNPSP